jgi:hypothetical protein
MIELKDKFRNAYDDGNIPEIDCPPLDETVPVEPMPEKYRPQREGAGGGK